MPDLLKGMTVSTVCESGEHSKHFTLPGDSINYNDLLGKDSSNYLTYFINFKMVLFPYFDTFDTEMNLIVTISQAAGMTHRSLPIHVNLILFPDSLIKQLRPINISVHKP